MSAESPAAAPHAVRVRGYMAVFVALLCLTFLTVFVSTLHLARPRAIAIALAIAAVKAGLVAAVFMHLASEKKSSTRCSA